MKKLYFIILLGIVGSAVSADTLTVTIKGLDDGRKTIRQKDFQEALLDAQRQAVEQAGVRIESKTTVLNSQVQRDFIESQAKAVLLPGFQVIDIGYTADGTYQVVLSGRVQVVKQEQPESRPGVLALVMDLYSVPITFQLDGKPFDANKPFLAVGVSRDSQAVRTFASLRELKKQYNNLHHYFIYLFHLQSGKHTLNIRASVLLGSERIEKDNAVEAEVAPGAVTVYEYRAHPQYGFDAADREFLLERFLDGNRFRDTTAAFRGRIRQELTDRIGGFAGFTF